MNRVEQQLAALEPMTVAALRVKYERVFAAQPTSTNRPYLCKRIGYRIQELAYGGLSERARARIAELSAGLAMRLPQVARLSGNTPRAMPPAAGDRRLPAPGTILRRTHADEVHEVTVLATGFSYRGEQYPSLSTIATMITGTRWNGHRWFGLRSTP